MKITLIVLLLAVLSLCRRQMEVSISNEIPATWEAIQGGNNEFVRLTFFLKLQNTDKLQLKVKTVSDPDHKDYGNFLTFSQLSQMISPERKYLDRVLRLLREHGAEETTIDVSKMGDVIRANVPTEQAERMLDCKYSRFLHTETGITIMRAPNGYSLPDEVAEVVSFVAGVVGFPSLLQNKSTQKQSNRVNVNGITPDVIRSEYNITRDPSSRSGKSTQAVASFLQQYFSQSDLDQFLSKYKITSNVPKVIGKNIPSRPGVEASLDIQYLIAVGENITTTFVYTDGLHEQQEPFLDWVTNMMDMGDESALVHSISYGEEDKTISLDYQIRVDQEFQKFITTGRTILIASGDSGVGCREGKFSPVWPGGSPHITAVGATSTADLGVTFSGGGFSNVFAQQEWQKSATDDYFNKYGLKVGLPDAKYYNRTGRGYPDVSAFGVNFAVIVNGYSNPVSGTSASAPLFAGVVSLLNDVRLKAGKKPLGFLNPVLYSKLADGFRDIKRGQNGYDSCPGFYASEKWDPMTGWGTPNVARLAELVLQF
ncbi:tripeptidyl-peptidase I [Acrasis kona]|uniref:Tripeptidyl-peptidase I n=1 Tax=Acrasis kona TaxID=1008807 RepID=A0AAW2YX74_9EUKA